MRGMMPRFSGKNIPVTIVARIIGKDQQFVRQAMMEGLLPIGVAFRKKGSSQYDFYVSPKLLYEYTGFFFDDIIEDDNCKMESMDDYNGCEFGGED